MSEFGKQSVFLPTTVSRYQIPKLEYGCRWLEVYGAFVASLAFFCSGIVQSYTSPAIYSIESDGESNLSLTRSDILWFASGPSLAAFVGTALSAPLLEFFGRQKSLVVSALPSIIGWILIGFATNVTMLHAGRIFTGLTIGIARAAAPVYVSEISPPNSRGLLGFFPPMMNALGILLGLWVGCWIQWRKLAIFVSIFPILLLFLSLWLPESPLWLLLHEQGESAFKSLMRLRGSGRRLKVQEEMAETRSSIEEVKVSLRNLDWRDLIFRKENYLAFSLMIFQQFSGVSTVIYYLAMILDEATPAGGRIPRSLQPETAGLTVGIVHFVAFFISLPLIDRLGRRVLLIVSGSLMAISHAMLALFLYFHLEPNGTFVHATESWLPLTALCAFIAAFSIGFGPVPFVFMTEVFSLRFRGYLSSVATLIAQIASFSVLQLFPIMLKMISPYYVFLIYAVECILAVAFVFFKIPETKGKSLAEIEKYFRTPNTLLEEKENHHMTLDRVEVPFVYVPVARLILPDTDMTTTTPTKIYCKSPAAL